MGMIESVQRWMVPAVAALAVLAVIAVGVGVWQATGNGGEVGAADGGGTDPGGGAPPDAGAQPPGSPAVVPGDPGSDDPGDGREPLPPAEEPDDSRRDPGYLALDSYYPYDARRLALNYYNGVPECYGKAGTPQVEERERKVLVKVPRTPPTAPKGTVCIEIAVAGSVDITLDQPLGDRKVVDAASGRVLSEADAPYDEQAPEGDQPQ